MFNQQHGGQGRSLCAPQGCTAPGTVFIMNATVEFEKTVSHGFQCSEATKMFKTVESRTGMCLFLSPLRAASVSVF